MPLTPDPEIQRFVGLLLQEIGSGTQTVTVNDIQKAVGDALDRYNNGDTP